MPGYITKIIRKLNVKTHQISLQSKVTTGLVTIYSMCSCHAFSQGIHLIDLIQGEMDTIYFIFSILL